MSKSFKFLIIILCIAVFVAVAVFFATNEDAANWGMAVFIAALATIAGLFLLAHLCDFILALIFPNDKEAHTIVKGILIVVGVVAMVILTIWLHDNVSF